MKWFLVFVSLVVMLFALSGCSINKEEVLTAEVLALQEKKVSLENEFLERKAVLDTEISYLENIRDGLIPKDTGIAYVVVLEISQSHITLDLGTMLKDSMNKIEFPIAVSPEYYYSVEPGTVVNDDFRMGSLIMKGSIGSWKITIKTKQIITQ
jgi:hypothetical protein